MFISCEKKMCKSLFEEVPNLRIFLNVKDPRKVIFFHFNLSLILKCVLCAVKGLKVVMTLTKYEVQLNKYLYTQ